jgi:hypothetical protein
MLLGIFQPQRPAPGRIRHGLSLGTRAKNLLAGFGGRKAPSSMGKMCTAGVLRLRAPSPVSRDKGVRRSAQDDAFAANFDENIPNTLPLMGRSAARGLLAVTDPLRLALLKIR